MIIVNNSSGEEDSPFCQKKKIMKQNEQFSASEYLFKEEVGEKGINLNEIQVSQFTAADEQDKST